LQFDLLNTNSVVVPDPTGALNFPFNQSMTFEALIQTTNSGQSNVGAIVGKVPSSSTASQWWWRVNAGKQQFLVRDANGSQFSKNGSAILTDGAWHSLAAVYDGSAKQLRLYVDGVMDGSPVSATCSAEIGNSTNLCIGQFAGTANRFFNGNMDFVRITAAALDPSSFVQPGPARAPGPLQLASMVWTAGSGSFKFSTGTGHSYLVQSAAELPGPWTNVESVIGNGATITVNLPAADPQRFFRILEY
jgi:hypothetical protein